MRYWLITLRQSSSFSCCCCLYSVSCCNPSYNHQQVMMPYPRNELSLGVSHFFIMPLLSVFTSRRSSWAYVLSGPVWCSTLSAPNVLVLWLLVLRSFFFVFCRFRTFFDDFLFCALFWTCVTLLPWFEFFESFKRSYIYSYIRSIFVSIVVLLFRFFLSS